MRGDIIKTNIIEKLELIKDKKFPSGSMLDLNAVTLICFLLETKDILTSDEIDDLEEYSKKLIKERGYVILK